MQRFRRRHRQHAALAFAALVLALPYPAQTQEPAARDPANRVLAAYPEQIAAIRDGLIHFRDGTTMPFDDGKGAKDFKQWLAAPDVEDTLAVPYTTGPVATPPPTDTDPGRARNAAFFDKIYGDCRKGEVTGNLVDVVWLPKKWGKTLKVTRINGVAQHLTAVGHALDQLPPAFDHFLIPPAGTYMCRVIAGTNRVSAHGHGIAIDIATANADYWRWSKPSSDGTPVWRNRIPQEIVDTFEAHGFIWGGKWHHFDTMHFEYRPELLPGTANDASTPHK